MSVFQKSSLMCQLLTRKSHYPLTRFESLPLRNFPDNEIDNVVSFINRHACYKFCDFYRDRLFEQRS